MRPRVFPAEDLHCGSTDGEQGSPASMRPRVFPAEDRKPLGRPFVGVAVLQ